VLGGSWGQPLEYLDWIVFALNGSAGPVIDSIDLRRLRWPEFPELANFLIGLMGLHSPVERTGDVDPEKQQVGDAALALAVTVGLRYLD
jgi:hypothetical protein